MFVGRSVGWSVVGLSVDLVNKLPYKSNIRYFKMLVTTVVRVVRLVRVVRVVRLVSE